MSAKTKKSNDQRVPVIGCNRIGGHQRRPVTKYEVLFRDRETFIFVEPCKNKIF